MLNETFNASSLLNDTFNFLDDAFRLDDDTFDIDDDIFGFHNDILGVSGNGSSPGVGGRNKTRTRPPRRQRLADCYECTRSCVYKPVEILFVLGVVANAVVVWRTIVDRRLRTPTFVAIACLAFADAAFLSVNLISTILKLYNSLACRNVVFQASPEYKTVVGVFWFASNAHISILAGVRYFLLMHPLKANVHLTKKRVVMASVAAWLLSTIFWTAMDVARTCGLNSRTSSAILVGIWAVVFFSPLIITVVLHIVKWRRIRRNSVFGHATEHTQVATWRLSNILLLVIICAIVLPLPRFVVLNLITFGVRSSILKIHLTEISYILFLTNNSINPVFYAFRSRQFKRSIGIWKHNLRKTISSIVKSRSSRSSRSTNMTNIDSPETSPRIRRNGEVRDENGQSVRESPQLRRNGEVGDENGQSVTESAQLRRNGEVGVGYDNCYSITESPQIRRNGDVGCDQNQGNTESPRIRCIEEIRNDQNQCDTESIEKTTRI